MQLALLSIKKRSTDNILHCLPVMVPELQMQPFMRRLTARGLTDESFVGR